MAALLGIAQRAEADCFKEIHTLSRQVIALSALTFASSLITFLNTSPPMGELGHFTHDFTLVLMSSSAWGLATGIGLRRAWRWAWISMLVFGALLAGVGVLLALPFLLMPGGGSLWWDVLAGRMVGALFFFVAAFIGVRWFTFLTQDRVRAYFRVSRRSPPAAA